MRSMPVLSLALLASACGGEPAVAGDPPPGGNDPAANGRSADATVALERIDASPECDGIVPSSAPPPVAARRTPPAGAICAGGVSDGTGHVAVAARDGSGASWQVFAADGTPLRAFSAWPAAPEPDGWQGVRTSPGADRDRPVVEVVAFASDGSVRRATQVSLDPGTYTAFRWSFGADPAGGSILLLRAVTLSGNHWHLLTAQRFDAGGAPAFASPARVDFGSDPSAPMFMAAGVSTSGGALAAWQSSAFLPAAWIGLAGDVGASGGETTAGALGQVSFAPHDLALVALLDGGLALRLDGTFRRAYPPGETATRALPEWLASRADWSFRFARGGRAYAVFPPAGRPSADCTQSLDLVSRGGRLCGRVTLREGGTGCTTGAVDLGWDGTVVQQSGRDRCAYRWWSRLLAGD